MTRITQNRLGRLWRLGMAVIGVVATDLASSPTVAADTSPLVQLHFDGETKASMKYRDLSISAESAPAGTDADMKVAVFHLQFDDGRRLDVKFPDDEPTAIPRADLRIYALDRSTAFPQIVLSYFWNGAHCCTMTKIVTMDGSNRPIVVDAQTLDGSGYAFEDLDGDGSVELLSFDNSFNYAFASYAESVAPVKVSKLRAGQLVDVTTERPYRAALQRRLNDIEAMDKDIRKSNGYWGGWVAAKAQLGQFTEAWIAMLAAYDRSSDWTMQECVDYTPLEKCPKDKVRNLAFPEALAKHLQREGYIKLGDMREAIQLSRSLQNTRPAQPPAQPRRDPSLELCVNGEDVVRRIIIGQLTGKRPAEGQESPAVTVRDVTLDGTNDKINKTTCSATVNVDLRALLSELATKNEMRAVAQLGKFAARKGGGQVTRRVTYTVQPTAEPGRIWVNVIQ